MTSYHIPVHDSGEPNQEMIYEEDAFDELLDLTFPPLRYASMFHDRPVHPVAVTKNRIRRNSSRERERLYRELVGHGPYVQRRRDSTPNDGRFSVHLDVKHFRPDEITLKVEGKEDYLLYEYKL